MGCNSHLSIEFRIKNQDYWQLWALDLPENRDYNLYEAMAGVRGEKENAVVPPRGIPVDCCHAIAYWIKRADSDGHTHSWLYPFEFRQALKKAPAEGELMWDILNDILSVLESQFGDTNVRLVFFFDN